LHEKNANCLPYFSVQTTRLVAYISIRQEIKMLHQNIFSGLMNQPDEVIKIIIAIAHNISFLIPDIQIKSAPGASETHLVWSNSKRLFDK